MKKYTLSIEGMHCASCASNIERSLKKIEGVKNVSVILLMNKAKFESEKAINKDEIKQAVAKTGYKVLEIRD